MNICAYCAKSFEISTRQAAGVAPLTCPPYSADTLTPGILQGYDLLYFDMHGLPGLDYWFEEVKAEYGMTTRIKAITADQLRSISLVGTVIFATNCYLGDDDSPMLEALLAADARYVIGGGGKNWARMDSASGAAALGRLFRIGLEWGYDALNALTWAKYALPRIAQSEQELQDTLQFRAFYRPKGEGAYVTHA